jgi:NADPH:quinone reductase-like Zn-dependent oxidoreductase
MAQNFENQAAWILAEKERPLKVGPWPKPDPAENEVVIKVAYAAVNPTDWKVTQSSPNRSETNLTASLDANRCVL